MKTIKMILLLSLIAYTVSNANMLSTITASVSINSASADTLPLRKGRFVPFGYLQNDKFRKPSITIYPNPAILTANVKSEGNLEGFDLEIFDQRGLRCMKQANWNAQTIDVSKLQTGIYFVRFKKGKESYLEKLVVQNE
ncbi:T9SS type A sorting domain-containing protein [Dyadobacter alkalitolerans]|uniref:T9SS type A sorting domain-containing protein n=1 Tax=Dyadobacter alkalitolerans TaxID=492736 RepID=UPI00055781D1|nr:T9SS type A sorting domain-containing protein [Dyadobacter alkalitolerans]